MSSWLMYFCLAPSPAAIDRRKPLDIFRGGSEGRRQDDDDEDVHAFDALHAGWGGGEEGGDCRVKGGSKGAGGDEIHQNAFKTYSTFQQEKLKSKAYLTFLEF